MTHGAVARRSVRITIDLAAIRNNYSVARARSGSRAFAVIKADAYGHGAVRIANALPSADGFAVVTLGEAIELRDAGVEQPILVLQGPQSANEARCFEPHRLWSAIHQTDQLAWASGNDYLQNCTCWLKVDTGMGRLGFLPDEAGRLLSPDGGRIRWRGVMSHLASADMAASTFTETQLSVFGSLPVPPGVERSLANSAAILGWPDTRQDWSRPGIMLYGCDPRDTQDALASKLMPAMQVEAPLIAVKRMPAGSTIGYAQTHTCAVDSRVGFVAIGYADGLPRSLSPAATVGIDGVSCPVIGRVSMDSIAVDLSALPSSPEPGTLVTIWGEGQPVETLAQAAGTIGYELLTAVRGVRRYVGD